MVIDKNYMSSYYVELMMKMVDTLTRLVSTQKTFTGY
jgi:hypothetical protein